MNLQSFQVILEAGAKLLALVATLCMALSVLFDWGYLAGLGLTFSEVPTSLSDHTRSAVLWLPLVVSVFPLAVVVTLFTEQFDAKHIREAESRGEDISTHIDSEAKNARRILAIFAPVGFMLWLAFGDRTGPFFVLAAMALWALVVARAADHDYHGIRLSMNFNFYLLILPIIAFVLYMGGYTSGRKGIPPYQEVGTIDVHSAENQYKLKANVVRFFDKTVIVIDENGKVLLLKPENIVQVKKAKSISIDRGGLCDYWRISCPDDNIHAQ